MDANDQQAPSPVEDPMPECPSPPKKPEKDMVVIPGHGPQDPDWVAGLCAAPKDDACGGTGRIKGWVCHRAKLRAKAYLDEGVSKESAERRWLDAEEELTKLVAEFDVRKAAFELALVETEKAHAKEVGAEDLDGAVKAAEVKVDEASARLSELLAESVQLEERLETVRREVAARLADIQKETEAHTIARDDASEHVAKFQGLKAERAALLERGRKRFERDTEGLRKKITRAQQKASLERARLGVGR